MFGRIALSLMSLVVGLALLSAQAPAETPTQSAAAGDLPVKASMLSKKSRKLRVEVGGRKGSACTLAVNAGKKAVELGDLTLDNQGQGAWQWVVPKNAPSGKWRFKVACERSDQGSRGRDRLKVKSKGNGKGQLIAPSSSEVSQPPGAGAGSNFYAWHQCTWHVKEVYPEVHNGWGDAHGWDDGARRVGWPVFSTPKPGAIAVWEAWPGVRTGHVAIVDAVHPDGFIDVQERNWRPMEFGTRKHIPTAAISGAKGNPQWFICPPGRCREADRTPQFDDVRVYSSNTLDVGPGQGVGATVTARYMGPYSIPCGQINLGVRGDGPAVYADHFAGFWPASPWRSPSRVAIAGCNGNLDPGEHATWNLSFKPPANAPAGVQLTGVYAPVWEHVGWAGVNIPISLNVRKAGEIGNYPEPDPNAPPFAAQMVSQTFPKVIAPGSPATVTIKVKNVGRSQWDENVRLATPNDSAIRNVISGTIGAGKNRVPLADVEGDGLVAPGEVATFTYEVQSSSATAYRQPFDLVRDGTGPRFAQNLGIFIPTVIADSTHFPPELTAGDCTWSFVTQAGTPASASRVNVSSSSSSSWSFTIKNSSVLCPWFSSGPNATRLATRRPTDRGSGFSDVGNGWLSPNRVALPGNVAPGDTVEIPMGLRALASVPQGNYDEHMAPVIDGEFHLADQGMFIPARRVP